MSKSRYREIPAVLPMGTTTGRAAILLAVLVLSMEVNYYVEQPDAFGPRWFIGFNVAPVVENALASLFR